MGGGWVGVGRRGHPSLTVREDDGWGVGLSVKSRDFIWWKWYMYMYRSSFYMYVYM